MSPRPCKSILGVSRMAAKFTRSTRLCRDPLEIAKPFSTSFFLPLSICTTCFVSFLLSSFFSLFSFFPFFEGKLIRRFRSRSADFLTLKKQPIESRENEPSEKLDLSCTLVFGISFGIFVGKRSVTWMVIKACFWFSIN